MRRSALREFIERAIVATLPLATATCGDGGMVQDLGLAADLQVADLGVVTDLGPPGEGGTVLDFCERQHPPVSVMLPAGTLNSDGGTDCYSSAFCAANCPPKYTLCCGPLPGPGGTQLLSCAYNCGPAGRRPAGLQPPLRLAVACVVGQHFAAMAHLEAASVRAFRVLRRELRALGAPSPLVQAAQRAARDEVRHARSTAAVARAHGGTPARVTVAPSTPRSLVEIAVENAAEGCVRETYGALLATWQARTAQDPLIQKVMSEIAGDETRHAELAWAVDAWASTRLDRAARRRVAAVRRATAAALLDEVAEPPPALRASAGLPSAAQSRALLSAVTDELWS